MTYVRFANGTYNVVCIAVPGTLIIDGSGDDVNEVVFGQSSPKIRDGINHSGSVRIEVDDQSAYSRNIATLMALNSPLGIGDYTIYIDGYPVSYHALLTVTITGGSVMMVDISWAGTINA